MDAFTALQSSATSTFPQVTGVTIEQITGFASTTLQSLVVVPLDFLLQNHAQIIAYGMIGSVLLVAVGALRFYYVH